MTWIGLGSNRGDRVVNLMHAANDLSILPQSSLLVASSIYRTSPVGIGFTGEFYNAVIGLLTGLQPEELLAECQRIEEEMGRDRAEKDRPIDIDILLYGDRIIDTEDLKIPHPEMTSRRFVLEPMVELAPKTVHPVLKLEVRRLLEDKSWAGQNIIRLAQPLFPSWGC